jgi:DNA-binding NtrC family response regulator
VDDPEARTIDVEHLRLEAFPNEPPPSIAPPHREALLSHQTPPPPSSSSSSAAPESTTPQSLKDLERARIESVLRDVGGRVEEAGRILGMPRSSLYFKIRKYGIVVAKG